MKTNIENIISNTLANIYDWESEDLKSDFIEFINSEYQVDKSKLEVIFDKFNSLSPLERDSINFDLNNFVSNGSSRFVVGSTVSKLI